MEQLGQTFNYLVCSLLIVGLGTLNCVQQSFTFLGHTIEGIVYAMMLPRVLNEENVQQQISVMTHVVAVGKAALPQQFGENGPRKVGIFPAAILQQLDALLAHIGVFNKFFDVAKYEKN